MIVGAIAADQVGFANGLKAKIAAAGLSSRVIMTGELPIEELPRWYQRLTIYAFTSRNEGFGLTLIEAMSSGAALVAARAGAAELVVEDGVSGVLVAPGEVDRRPRHEAAGHADLVEADRGPVRRERRGGGVGAGNHVRAADHGDGAGGGRVGGAGRGELETAPARLCNWCEHRQIAKRIGRECNPRLSRESRSHS